MGATTQQRAFVVFETEVVLSQVDRLRAAIARHGGECDWRVDSSGWVVTLHLPQERTFIGQTLEAALSACVVWLTPSMPTVTSARHIGPTQFQD